MNTFDSSVKVLTTTGSLIGATGKFTYSVLTESAYAPVRSSTCVVMRNRPVG